MLRANYIHYIAIYSRSARAAPKSWVVWVSFGSALGAVWVKANPLLLLPFSDKYIYRHQTPYIHVSHFAECFSPTLGIKSLYWVSTSLSYPLHLVSEAAMTAD